jgi:hypothetical protein
MSDDIHHEAHDLVEALRYLAESLLTFEGDLASINGLAVLVDALADRAEAHYRHCCEQERSAPDPDDGASRPQLQVLSRGDTPA